MNEIKIEVWDATGNKRQLVEVVSLLVDEARNGVASAARATTIGTPASSAPNEPTNPTAQGRRQVVPSRTAEATPNTAAVAAVSAAEIVHVHCPRCQTAYRIAIIFLGRKVRCKKCGDTFECVRTETSAGGGP